LATDPGRQLRRLHELRDVVDEGDQHRQCEEGKTACDRQRQPRNGSALPGDVPDRTKRDEAVREDPYERSDRELCNAVAEVVPHHTRAELARRQLQHHHRHREREAGNGDQRAGDHREDGTSGLVVPAEDQPL
jgi:hypothetical protein